jgi:hypothetical protein
MAFPLRMHFDDHAIGADSDRGAPAAAPGCVCRWRGWDRVTGRCVSSFQHRHGHDVAGVARGGFKGADAALAQHDVGIAVGHDVLGRHQ